MNAVRLEHKDDPTYWQLLDAVQRKHPAYDLEIRNGEYVVVAPHDFVSARLVIKIASRIERWIEATHAGFVFDSNAGVLFADGDLMAPDVTYVSRMRMPVVPPKPIRQDYVVRQGFPSLATPTRLSGALRICPPHLT